VPPDATFDSDKPPLKEEPHKRQATSSSGTQIAHPTSYSIPVAPQEPLDPTLEVNILSQLPPEFSRRIESLRWKIRNEVLEETLKLILATPRIKYVDAYQEFVQIIATRLQDPNVCCVVTATTIIQALSQSLGRPLGKHGNIIVPSLLERLKDRNRTVVDAVNGALGAFLKTARQTKSVCTACY
jgi:hypothetical protein